MRRIISIVGAGGKTSLMYHLARRYSAQGFRTLVTTTTHIVRPEPEVWARDAREAEKLWHQGSYAVVGKDSGGEKFSMLPPEELENYIRMAEVTLIEADGAKGLPCKVPAFYEPVILNCCDTVIGVMGMDALDQKLQEVCFRWKEAEEWLNVSPETRLTVELMAEILASEHGTRKAVKDREYLVVLNQCDTPELERQGRKILSLLKDRGIKRGVIACLKEGKVAEDEGTFLLISNN